MHPGTLVIAFGDPAVNFANGKLRGSNYINPKGYEVDLAAAIAKRLNLTPKWVYAPWAKLFAPGAKGFDISFQEATITAQRKKTVDFTSSHFNANQGVLLSRTAKTPPLRRRPEEPPDLRPDGHDRPDRRRADDERVRAGRKRRAATRARRAESRRPA